MRSEASALWDYNVQRDMDEVGIICRYVSTPTAYASGRHVHTGIGIVYCVKGRGIFNLGDQILPYSAGTLVYFDSRVPHQVCMETPYDRWDVCIRSEVADRLLENELFRETARRFLPGRLGSRVFYIPEPERARFDHIFRELHWEAQHRREGFEVYVQCKLIELFILFSRLAGLPVGTGTAQPAPISEILAHIDRELPRSPSVEEIARTFHYSPSHLYRLIRSATGKTPSQYIRDRKIERAKQLLVSSGLTVSSIGRAVGMPNVPYFCKTFRLATGYTPQEYRLRHRRPAGLGEEPECD